MPRRRYVSTNISTDTKINRLASEHGDFAAMLYTWMIPHAEDDGGLPSDPEELLFIVIPGRRDKSARDVAVAIDAMVNLGLLLCDGTRIRFPPQSFYRYQSYVTEQRRTSAQRDLPSKEEPQNSEEQRESAQNSASSSSSFPVSFSHSVSRYPGASAPCVCADSPSESEPPDEIDAVFAYYRARIQPNARLCPRKQIKTRLKRWSVDELTAGIDHFAGDSWWMEHNAHRGAAWFFHSDNRSEQFLNLIPRQEQSNGRQTNGIRTGAARNSPAMGQAGAGLIDAADYAAAEQRDRERQAAAAESARASAAPGGAADERDRPATEHLAAGIGGAPNVRG